MSALPAPVQRALTFALPPVALIILCMVMIPRQNRLRQIDRDVKASRAQIDDYLDKLKTIRELPPDPQVATMPLTQQEQSNFLRGLSALCTRSGNQIIAISSLSAPAVPPPPPPGAPPSDIPPDVIEIKSNISFEGDFTTVRSFLAALQRSRRLITLSDCRISAIMGSYARLRTDLTLARYVDAPPGWGAPPPGAPAPGGPQPAPAKS